MGEIKPREISLEQGAHLNIRTASEDDAEAILNLYRSVIAEGRYYFAPIGRIAAHRESGAKGHC